MAIACTLIPGFSHTGLATVLYGFFIVMVMYGAITLFLAEMAA